MGKAPEAGNTAESLRGINVIDAASVQSTVSEELSEADLYEYLKELDIAAQTAIDADPVLAIQIESDQVAEEIAAVKEQLAQSDDEPTEYVTRKEYDDLLARIEHFNTRSGHYL